MSHAPITSREIRFANRPEGIPTADTFSVAEVDVPSSPDGQVQVRNLWMSVDPYMRGRMRTRKSYVPPFEIGEPLQGGAIGRVEASACDGFAPGDLVQSMLGWREVFNAPRPLFGRCPAPSCRRRRCSASRACRASRPLSAWTRWRSCGQGR